MGTVSKHRKPYASRPADTTKARNDLINELKKLLRDAKSGRVVGIGVVELHACGQTDWYGYVSSESRFAVARIALGCDVLKKRILCHSGLSDMEVY
jgi:hypothetical protein